MNEHELSDALRGSLPPRPSARGWADGARGKARNRRLAVTGVAGLIVAALAVPLALQVGREPSIVASPAPTSSAAPLPGDPLPWVPDACQDPADGALPLVDDDLPPGATSMWLCGRNPLDPEWLVGSVGAPDPLVTDLDAVAGQFNAMEKSEGVLDCMPTPLDYTLVVEYPDGKRTLQIAGCGDLRDATDMFRVFRADGEGFLASLKARWSDQRAEAPFFWGGADVCSMRATSAWGPVPAAELTRAVACGADPVAIPDDVARRLIDSFTELGAPRGEEIGLGGPPTLVLLTAAGDPVSLVDWGEDLGWAEAGANHAWPIPADLRAELDAYLQQAGERPEPEPAVELPSERGDTLEPTVCADVFAGVLPPEALPATEALPTGVARAWLCGAPLTRGRMGPVEPLTREPGRVAEAINALPAATAEACTLMAGPTYHVVLDYPDGGRRVLAVETVNCEFVGGMERTGGAGLIEDLIAMWQKQREEAPAPFTDEVLLCEAAPPADLAGAAVASLMPVTRPELVRGVVCGLPAGGAEDAVVEVALPPELLMDIGQSELAAPVEAWSRPPGLPYLVLLNQYGDPVVAGVGEDLTVGFVDGVWGPEGDLADLWRETLAPLNLEPR